MLLSTASAATCTTLAWSWQCNDLSSRICNQSHRLRQLTVRRRAENLDRKNCSGSWMLLRESSAARDNSTVARQDLCTMTCTDWTSHSTSRSSCSSVHMAWHRSISPSYVFRLMTSLAAAICALPLQDYWIFLGSTWETMVNGRSHTPVLMPGTHCRKTCDKLHRWSFSSALSKRSYSGSRRV